MKSHSAKAVVEITELRTNTKSHLLVNLFNTYRWSSDRSFRGVKKKGDLKKVQNGLTGLTLASVSFQASRSLRVRVGFTHFMDSRHT